MSDVKNIFADGLARVTVRGGVVRLTFGTQEEKQNEQVEMIASHQVIMPMAGFLNAFNVMQGIVAKMEKDGLVKKVENQPKSVIEAN